MRTQSLFPVTMQFSGMGTNYQLLLYNAHLFGRTAEYFSHAGLMRRETGFYFHDARRLPQIIEGVRRVEADGVGFTEIWDHQMAGEICDRLRDVYPYHAISPSAHGLKGLLAGAQARWPTLSSPLINNAETVIDTFTSRHYGAGKSSLVSALGDRVGRALAPMGPIWGAGLLFLSRYPIVEDRFHDHPARADWEHMTRKGVLSMTVELPSRQGIRLTLGHYQEGESPAAIKARQRQIRFTKNLLGEDDSGIAMGDYNIVDQTLEYEWMLSTLGLEDPGSEATYRDPNPYQAKLKAPAGKASSRRLDYIFHGSSWRALSMEVLADAFLDQKEGFPLSDHFPVLARLQLL